MSIPYWRLSGFYFFYFATVGSFIPYWSLYLKDAGYNPAEIGQLSALLIGTKIIAPGLWGWLADRSGKSLFIIRLASFFAAMLFAGFLFFQGYLWFAVITVGFSFFWNAALPQFEAATLFHLKDQPHRYSQIRLWGSIGFILAVLGVGRLLDVYPIALLPAAITALLVGIWLVSLLVPDARPSHHGEEAEGIWKIVTKPAVLAFWLVGMLMQSAHAPYYVFYSLYLKNHAYSSTLIGGLWALGVVAEIVLFVFMKPLLARVSLRHILLCSIFLAIARWQLIAWCADNLWLLLLAQLLHAASFGSTHVAAIHLVQNYFGSRHQGKGQALYAGLCMGLGGMVGSLYSGYFWELLGGELVFAIGAASGCLAFLAAFIWIGREKAEAGQGLG